MSSRILLRAVERLDKERFNEKEKRDDAFARGWNAAVNHMRGWLHVEAGLAEIAEVAPELGGEG